MHMNGMGFGLMGWSMWIVWIILAIGFVWFLKVMMTSMADSEKSSLDILDERYAKGEIDKKEYFEKKKNLLKQ